MTPEQAADKYAENNMESYYDYSVGKVDTRDALGTAFLAGHAHAQNRWVKVEDGLPENRAAVICYTLRHTVLFARYDEGKWIDSVLGEETIQTITHWQPMIKLPQPPEHG